MKIQSAKAGIGTGRAGLQAASGLFSSAGLFQKGVKSFHPNELDPYLLFDAERLPYLINTMSNLPYAFLESVPVFKNLAKGSNAGGDAVQTTALNQPKALPLIDGDGYLYCPVATSNYANVEDPIIPATANFDLSIEFIVAKFASGSGYSHILGQYQGGANGRVHLGFYDHQKRLYFFCGGDGTNPNVFIQTDIDAIVEGQRHTARVTRVGNTFTLYLDGVLQQTTTSGVAPLQTVGTQIGWANLRGLNGAIFSVTEGSNTNIDFTATNVRHGDTKFKCATGQVVTINQSGPDPAKIIKRSVLRFDGVNSSLQGLFANNINGGYMFAAFSVLGDGGEAYGRIFGANISGGFDYQNTGFALRRLDSTETLNLRYSGGSADTHQNLFDDDRGDLLLESRLSPGSQKSKVNDADANNGVTTLADNGVAATRYSISSNSTGDSNLAIDLEFLALLPASITDTQADSVRNYINNRNNVFDLKDGFGYYFYDATKAPVGAITTGSSAWNGRIVGSDNGDSDRYATQGTTNDAPVGDGYVVTFADNSDHLDIPQVTQAGWQVVGTSLATFAYRVNANAVTELNLLGNLGDAAYRQTGDLYGVILLPESATGADIEEARRLLIDRGAADGTTASSANLYFYNRSDLVEFKGIDFSSVNTLRFAWRGNINLVTFPSLQLTNATDFYSAWESCASLSDFGAIQASNGTNFSLAWKNCTSLTSFPAGAKLGTAATNVNFSNAFRSSGLTSFPALDLSTGSTFSNTFNGCSSLTTINSGVLLGTASTNVNFQNAFFESGLTDLPSGLDLSKGSNFAQAFKNCSSLTAFPAGVFDTMGTPVSSCFSSTFVGCSALSATSVENILVSIDTSGQSAPSTGPQIHVDYNVATGSLSAATNAAIESLIGKGWQVFINGVLTIPNVLTLAPAAAYSLRSFDADADPVVVNVRRSSDSASSNFKASEVTDGTLVAFVGAGNDGHVTTFYDQSSNGQNSTQVTASSQPKIVDSGTLVTEGGLAALSFLNDSNNLEVPHNDVSNQARLDSYYVIHHGSPDNNFIFPSNIIGKAGYIGQINSASTGITDFPASSLYTNSTLMTGNTRGAVWNAHNGHKLIVYDNGSTTGWGNNNIYFGQTGAAAGTFSFTGKLQEMIFFNTDQSANRTGIEANINDTYTIY